MVLGAILIVVCLILLVVGFVAPRFSQRQQGKADEGLNKGQGKASRAPGFLGKLFPKSIRFSKKAVDKSSSAGRKGRDKV